MSCMCGDICCPSCGPAQGNWRCPICREWASEGCAHIGEDGEISPEFREQAEAATLAEVKDYAKLAEDLEEAAEWAKQLPPK